MMNFEQGWPWLLDLIDKMEWCIEMKNGFEIWWGPNEMVDFYLIFFKNETMYLMNIVKSRPYLNLFWWKQIWYKEEKRLYHDQALD